MNDLISRQALCEYALNQKDKSVTPNDIMRFPSAQSERPVGEWIQKPRYEDDKNPDAQPNLKCPFCGYEISWWDMGNYCAKCGADLKGSAK